MRLKSREGKMGKEDAFRSCLANMDAQARIIHGGRARRAFRDLVIRMRT